MRITYIDCCPLDGEGTLLNPAFKWVNRERQEFCDSISKAGECWYMFRGGFVYRSIEVEKITKIEQNGVSAECKYYKDAQYPFNCRFKKDGKEFGAGYKDFASLVRDFYLYSKL